MKNSDDLHRGGFNGGGEKWTYSRPTQKVKCMGLEARFSNGDVGES